ncbi:hypothetical protein GCM10027346_19600 [Hymenobacter seoulensis]
MKTFHTCLLTLAMLLLLVVGSRFAQAAQPVAASPESVKLRTERLTGYLTQALQLNRQQQRAVAKSTRKYLQQLSTLPASANRAAMVATNSDERLLPVSSVVAIEKEYSLALGRILTPGQYNAYSWLHMHQPEEGSR